ncbi:MAG: amidohydrolase family protein [Pirellulaceae bacterium]
MLGRLLFIILVCWPGFAPVHAADRYPGREWSRLDSPEQAGWSSEKLQQARELSGTLDTAALMIVHNGVVVDEWGTTALPLNCHSIRKSLLSLVYGPHVAAGTISLDKKLAELGIDDNEPSLTEAEQQATLGDLLKARSGVFHPALYETAAMAAKRPQRGSHPPGTFWYYNNWDFNAACSIFENLTGGSLFEEFERRLAGPLQMQDFVRTRHTRYVTGEDSVHPAYPFQLSARDLARVGLLALRAGKWQGRQVVSSDWIQESTQSYSDAATSGGYGYMWWVAVDGVHFPNVSLPTGTFSARGYRGHYLLVIPEWDLVVVHRVNTFQDGTRVLKSDFGKLLKLILAARPAGKVEKPTAASHSTDAFDLLLRGGQVVDGTGKKKFRADVAIADGRIVAVGDLAGRSAARIIDVTNQVVAPGFIDLHSHADKGLVSSDALRRAAPNLATQGITTVVINQDGRGPASIAAQRREMEKLGVGLNVIQMIGHGTIRRAALKDDYRRPARKSEIDEMRRLIREGMDAGAFGITSGLEYVPGRWSTPAEMKALIGQLTTYDGVYVVHERSSGSRPMWYFPSQDNPSQPSMIDNIQELIEIAAETRVNVVATHIKARGVDFWGSSRLMIDMISKARARGVTLYADQYAYNTSGSDGRIVLIPKWLASRIAGAARLTPAELLERGLADKKIAADLRRDIYYEMMRRGGGDHIVIVEHVKVDLIGKTLSQLAKANKCNEVEMAIRLQLQGDRTRPGGARLRGFSMSEKDVEALASQPWTATSTDAGIALPGDGPVHPRFYGAFPRKIRRFALDRKLISLEEAIRVSTSLPASILKLEGRGVIRQGAHADLVVFDPQRIQDRADAFKPHQYSEGVGYVLVGGELIVDQERLLGNLAGQVITRQNGRAPGTK